MIKITFKPKTLELELTGHAEHGNKGEDIVCSAISILFYTLGESLIQSEEMLKKDPVICIKDGDGFISCDPKEEYEGNIARTYWTVLNGLQLVADNYPENVTFTAEE